MQGFHSIMVKKEWNISHVFFGFILLLLFFFGQLNYFLTVCHYYQICSLSTAVCLYLLFLYYQTKFYLTFWKHFDFKKNLKITELHIFMTDCSLTCSCEENDYQLVKKRLFVTAKSTKLPKSKQPFHLGSESMFGFCCPI